MTPGFFCIALLLGVALAYSPVAWAGYLWDDAMFVTTNPVIVGPIGLKEIWTTAAADVCPLTLTAFWLEHPWWGMMPLPYHMLNVLLHGASAIVLWRGFAELALAGRVVGCSLVGVPSGQRGIGGVDR